MITIKLEHRYTDGSKDPEKMHNRLRIHHPRTKNNIQIYI